MKPRLKPLDQQVMVITGASSGIGLTTAAAAATCGAKLVLAARSRQSLHEICDLILEAGGQAVPVRCDVGDSHDVEQLAERAVEHFGRIDTWVNNAGVGMYAKLIEASQEDNRRLFDTNFWGVVYGSLAALPHLKQSSGALINVGSEVSEAVVPLLGMYSASKHAVKGFTDALRIEVQDIDKSPVSITLIEPTAVDTPFPQHARNYMDREPKLPTPQIEPIQVAEAILAAATTPTQLTRVGTMAKVNTAVAKYAPGAIADMLAAMQAKRQQCDEPPRNPMGALYEPSETCIGGQTRGRGCVST